MKILIIGGGGREHAIGRKLSQSPKNPKLIFAPGNPGMEGLGTCFPVDAEDLPGLLNLVRREKPDLTIVGPEQPLVAGIVDLLQENGMPVFGPTKAAAALEGSKVFAKSFMARHGIPTAQYKSFTDLALARAYVEEQGAPIVIKANGLAGGKGAVVCMTFPHAFATLESMLGDNPIFGQAGSEVVVEEYMEGEELSLFVLTDGEDFVLLPSAQDHKRVHDGDQGPNTGGMGAYSPAPILTTPLLGRIQDEIIVPTLTGMLQDGAPYTGILYVGLMITRLGPKVVEFNCRLGDPETQAVLPVLEEDLLDLVEASLTGRLSNLKVQSPSRSAAIVVMASGGYPGPYRTGETIEGLEEAVGLPNAHLIHAGTKREGGNLVTHGGRVLGLVGEGNTLSAAIEAAYQAVSKITFPLAHFRTDIGRKGLARLVN